MPATRTVLKDSDGNVLSVQEGESCNLYVSFVDMAGDAIPKASLATCTLTLFDEATTEIINARSVQNVKDANGGSVTSGGELTMRLDANDSVVVDDDLAAGDVEDHIARFEWTWNDGVQTRTGRQEFVLKVQKLATPTAP
jgi:hypothetical protein